MISHGQGKGNKSLKDKISLSKFKKFGADSLEDYSEKIKKMNIVDLCSHAIQFGIRANVDRKKMETSLTKEYKKARTQYLLATGEFSNKGISDVNEDKQKKVLDYLAFIKS